MELGFSAPQGILCVFAGGEAGQLAAGQAAWAGPGGCRVHGVQPPSHSLHPLACPLPTPHPNHLRHPPAPAANAIVLVPMVMVGHAGAKFGVPFPVLARAAFGVRGAVLPAALRGLVAAGWFG